MKTLIENKPEQLNRLCRKYKVCRLELFGSAAVDEEGQSEPKDLDFLVEFEPDACLGPWMAHYFEFQKELEKAFEYPVDLVMASASKNRYFISEVNKTRRLLYVA